MKTGERLRVDAQCQNQGINKAQQQRPTFSQANEDECGECAQQNALGIRTAFQGIAKLQRHQREQNGGKNRVVNSQFFSYSHHGQKTTQTRESRRKTRDGWGITENVNCE
jgi:hypothetical protein